MDESMSPWLRGRLKTPRARLAAPASRHTASSPVRVVGPRVTGCVLVWRAQASTSRTRGVLRQPLTQAFFPLAAVRPAWEAGHMRRRCLLVTALLALALAPAAGA